MLIEKEIIGPGTYFYTDEATGMPRKLKVTPDLTKYWHEQGTKMLSSGLVVPVPYEHDFTAHPMTPRDKLLNNAGEVKEYRVHAAADGRRDVLFGVVDVQDPAVKDKIGRSIRWTSPWISSFTDGNGTAWNNVITHLALTTRPRVTKQQPFDSIAAALSLSTETVLDLIKDTLPKEGFCLSRAGRLSILRTTKRLVPRYPMAFSLYAGGIPLELADMSPVKKGGKSKKDDKSKDSKSGNKPSGADDDVDTRSLFEDDEDPSPAGSIDAPGGDSVTPGTDAGATDLMSGPTDPMSGMADPGLANPLLDSNSDIKMEELLCDLLQALGVPMPDESNENEFKRHLYEAVMSKIKELTSKGMGQGGNSAMPDQNQPPSANPHASQPQQNPLIQQEQQPMFMSLDEIQKITDPTMRTIALSMHRENQDLRTEMDASNKVTHSLRDSKLKEANARRAERIRLLGKVSPGVKTDLDAMVALPSMALSLGDGGTVVDPMESTLAILEKGLSSIPLLLRTDSSTLSVASHPTDETALSEERIDALADGLARNMGCPPLARAS